MKGTLILVYTKYVPYNNRERFKEAIRLFGSECDFTLEEISAESERGQRLIENGEGASPQLLGFYPPHDYSLILNPNGGGYIFPYDSEFKNFFEQYKVAGMRFDRGDDVRDIIADANTNAQADVKNRSILKKAADVLGAPAAKVADLGKKIGIGLLVCAVGGAYLYYKAHQTNLTVNVNGIKKKA